MVQMLPIAGEPKQNSILEQLLTSALLLGNTNISLSVVCLLCYQKSGKRQEVFF